MDDLYTSPFSKGDRRKLIKISCIDGLTKGGSIEELIDGKLDGSFYFYEFKYNQWILFEFNKQVCIQQIKWIQSNNDTQHGTWQLQGSNDNKEFINIGKSFTLTNGIFDIDNKKRFKYYKLQQIGGQTTNNPWLYEIEFGINDKEYKFLLQQNNDYYSIESKFYNGEQYKSLDLNINPTIEDFKNYGFDDLQDLFEEYNSQSIELKGNNSEEGNLFNLKLNDNFKKINVIE